MSKPSFHVMAKPAGAACNLHCYYCFYYDKQALYPHKRQHMDGQVLEQFVKDYYASHSGPLVSFAWQGGEPTLAGLEFFREAVELQRQHCPPGWQFENALQTNGMLIDEEWAAFLAAEDFLIGLSWDGPGSLHDAYRGEGTGAKVQAAWRLLQQHGVKVNTLSVVHRENARQPRNVYSFLRGEGVEHLQFIPLVRYADDGSLTADSVDPLDYGRFLIGVWRQWLEHDVGSAFIQTFEGTLSQMAGLPAGLCVFAKTCGSNIIVEHNGDVYPCDHFVEAPLRLGNITEQSLEALVQSPEQQAFGRAKHTDLHADCLSCPVLHLCWGGCPKDRVAGKSSLCAGYSLFFQYTEPYHQQLLEGLRRGGAAPVVAKSIAQDVAKVWNGVQRNASCPCGSGLKYKRCCGSLQ